MSTAVVTGSSRGVGRAVARRLATIGYGVVVNYLHDQRAAESTVDAILAGNGAAVAVRADVTDRLDVQRLFAEAAEAFGGVDVTVHTVGPPELVHREAARLLRPGGALIDVLTATTAREVDHLIRALAAELRGRDVTVNALRWPAGGPDGVADAVAYLLDDRGRTITGQVLEMRGPGQAPGR
jgi:3-oxoacyl-[acyl-carrier protein] reductase